MNDYELLCPKDGEELVDGKCPKCGHQASETVTAFTDDELKRLKVWVKDNPHLDDDGLNIRGTIRLLERLAAAEDLADHGTCPDGAVEYPCRKRTKWLATRGIGI